MFTDFEEKIMSCGYFDIIYWGDEWIEDRADEPGYKTLLDNEKI